MAQLCVIDHGLHVLLSDQFRMGYAALWLALTERSEPKLQAAAARLGVAEHYETFPPVLMFVPYAAWLENRTPTAGELRMLRAGRGRGLNKPEEVAKFYNAMPPEFPVIMRTNQQMAGILWQLGGWAVTLAESMGAYAAKTPSAKGATVM